MLFGMRTSARSDDGPAAEASGVASVATATNPNLRGSRVGKWLVRRTPFYYGYVILLVGTIGKAFSAPGQTPVVGSVMDFIIDDLGMPASTVTTLYSSATLASSFTLFIIGWLLDRFGLRITGIATSIIRRGDDDELAIPAGARRRHLGPAHRRRPGRARRANRRRSGGGTGESLEKN